MLTSHVFKELDDWLVGASLENDICMLLNIHDAILFEIRDDMLDWAIPQITHIMENVQTPPFNLKVPFRADWKAGKNWSQATYE